MPKDEFDFDDPLELNGVGFVCAEDTTDEMCECFVEEFMRMGYNHKQILALFRNPHYLGMNIVLQNRGEPFVRERIGEIFARWGKTVTWPQACKVSSAEQEGRGPASATAVEFDSTACDPMGAAIPNLKL
jgi:hypothetical protein